MNRTVSSGRQQQLRDLLVKKVDTAHQNAGYPRLKGSMLKQVQNEITARIPLGKIRNNDLRTVEVRFCSCVQHFRPLACVLHHLPHPLRMPEDAKSSACGAHSSLQSSDAIVKQCKMRAGKREKAICSTIRGFFLFLSVNRNHFDSKPSTFVPNDAVQHNWALDIVQCGMRGQHRTF